MMLTGTAPFCNNSKIIPAKISIVPKSEQHKAMAKRHMENPATIKISANPIIIAQ